MLEEALPEEIVWREEEEEEDEDDDDESDEEEDGDEDVLDDECDDSLLPFLFFPFNDVRVFCFVSVFRRPFRLCKRCGLASDCSL